MTTLCTTLDACASRGAHSLHDPIAESFEALPPRVERSRDKELTFPFHTISQFSEAAEVFHKISIQ